MEGVTSPVANSVACNCQLRVKSTQQDLMLLSCSRTVTVTTNTREVFVGGRRETLVSLAFCRGP